MIIGPGSGEGGPDTGAASAGVLQEAGGKAYRLAGGRELRCEQWRLQEEA